MRFFKTQDTIELIIVKAIKKNLPYKFTKKIVNISSIKV